MNDLDFCIRIGVLIVLMFIGCFLIINKIYNEVKKGGWHFKL